MSNIKNILVVDDSRAMRMIVSRTLRQAGFGDGTLREAADGAEALAAIEAEQPDLVLSDWNMPNVNGIELLQALRAAGNEVRFGFITSESTTEMREQAIGAGAEFLLAKPFTADDFAEVIGAPAV
ncbi:MAG TPA: response regulator [Acidimicrobiales bacterium]